MKLKTKVRKSFCHMTQFVLLNLTANNRTSFPLGQKFKQIYGLVFLSNGKCILSDVASETVFQG